MTTAVYPGTFDPLTHGHFDIIRRGAALFDSVLVAVAENPGKTPAFSLDERMALAQSACAELANVTVIAFDGLLVHLMEERSATVLLRGLRSAADVDHELPLAQMNRAQNPAIETVFLTPAPERAYISSTLVREIARLGGDASPFVHPDIHRALNARYAR